LALGGAVGAFLVAGRAAAGRRVAPRAEAREDYDTVAEASLESFPASDAPSFSPTTGSQPGSVH
jgi:hypothetical protein